MALLKSTRHRDALRHLAQVRKRSSPGERVIGSIFPSRGSGYPGYWYSDRIQQVYHYRNWQYVAIDLYACKIASIMPNMAYSTDRPVKGRTVKACQRSILNLTGRGFGGEPYVGAELSKVTAKRVGDEWRNGKETTAWGNYVGASGWNENAQAPVGFSGGGHSFMTMGEWRSKALSVVDYHENLEPLDGDHRLRRLVMNPNPVDTWFDLSYETFMYRGLTGVSYLWAPKNSYGLPCELWCIPSHWVYPRTGAGQYVPFNHEHADELVWDYEIRPWGYPGYAGVLHFPPDEVIVQRAKHPLSKIDGYSKLAAGAQVIDLEEATTQSQWSQMINQAQPGMIVKLPPGYEDPDDSEIARIEAKFFARVQGAFNYGRPMFAPSGADVMPWGYNPTDMAYQSGQDQARDRVLALWKVPKSAIGMAEGMTYGSIMATLGQICVFGINPELTASGLTTTKFLASKFDERSPAYSTMVGNGHGSGEQFRRCKLWYDDCVPADPQQVNSDLGVDMQAYAVTPNEVRALRGRQPFRRGGDNPIVQGPGGPMPLVLNAEENVDDMAEIIARMTQAEGKETGEQQAEDVQVQTEGRVDAATVHAEGEEDDSLPGTQLSSDDHGGSGLEPPEKPNGKPSKSLRQFPLGHIGKDAGTCGPGQRSDLTGCTPASGEAGEKSVTEAQLNALDLDEDGALDVEHYPLPNASDVDDEYLADVWNRAIESLPTGATPQLTNQFDKALVTEAEGDKYEVRPVQAGGKQLWQVLCNGKVTDTLNTERGAKEQVAYYQQRDRENPSWNRKSLDRLGGKDPNVSAQSLATADFVTLPKGVEGTNCSNCLYQKDKVCQHPKLKGQKVNDRNCCGYWDNDEALRTWRGEKSLKWLHPAVRKQQSSPLVTSFPDVRQENHYECGAACFAAVCQHYSVSITVGQAAKLLGTNVQKSTDPQAIVRELRKLGIAAQPRKGMTVEQLRECTDAGHPVICCLQDYGDRREEGASFEYGHYMVALEASHGVVIFQDPSIENVEREPGGDTPRSEADRSGNVAMPGRVVLDAAKLVDVWHDQRANGEKLEQFGIVCGPRTQPGKQAKRAGTCEPGQTAARTGCTPASGEGGEHKPVNRIKDRLSKSSHEVTQLGDEVESVARDNVKVRGAVGKAYDKVKVALRNVALGEFPTWALDTADLWMFEHTLGQAGSAVGVPGAVILTKAAAWGAAKAWLTIRKARGKSANNVDTVKRLHAVLSVVAEAVGFEPPHIKEIKAMLSEASNGRVDGSENGRGRGTAERASSNRNNRGNQQAAKPLRNHL
ncbi:MAG: phage portal protein [Patescibacteria group bacterium]|nr:phage portal protein [Patescibacteria group bacterium]